METFECYSYPVCSDDEQKLQWVPHSIIVVSLCLVLRGSHCCKAGQCNSGSACTCCPGMAGAAPAAFVAVAAAQSEGLNFGVAGLRDFFTVWRRQKRFFQICAFVRTAENGIF